MGPPWLKGSFSGAGYEAMKALKAWRVVQFGFFQHLVEMIHT